MSARRFQPRRPLGRTGFVATAIGAGDLADRTLGLETCAATLRRALDAGLNVVDTAPQYEDGFSEAVVGAALRGRREGVFVIDKIDHLDAPVAPQLEGSLARLGLDAVDAAVFHDVSTVDAWLRLTIEGGAFDALEATRRAGKTRFVGLSSHHPDVLVRALASDRCDLVMFPVGPYVDRRYVDEILPAAKVKGVAVVSFKTFGAGKLVADTEGYGRPSARTGLPRLTVEECVRYTLTLDPDCALLGLSTPEEQDAAFDAAATFEPLDVRALADLRTRAAEAVQDKGRAWWNPR
ncbi:aldo/keto reductase [Myxococcota bacterium]|nr:aldo/keto reductase [Myxococcota bacterium]